MLFRLDGRTALVTGAGRGMGVGIVRALAAQGARVIVGDVVGDLRRYYHGLIILADPGLADQRLTGVYNLADPVGAIEAVARAHGGIVRHISPWILLIGQD